MLYPHGHDIRTCTVFLQPYFDTVLLCALSDYHVKISYPSISRDLIEGIVEQVTGIEPAKPSVWKTDMQPFTPHLQITSLWLPAAQGVEPFALHIRKHAQEDPTTVQD